MTRTRKRSVPSIDSLLDNWTSWRLVRPVSDPSNVTIEWHQQVPKKVVVNSQNRGLQVTVDENHGASWRGLIRDRARAKHSRSRDFESFSGDIGGPFSSTKTSVRAAVNGSQHLHQLDWRTSGSFQFQDHYLGPVLSVDPAGVLPFTSVVSSLSELNAAGTTAINRCAPTNSVASLFTSLTELYRDGLPAAVGRTLWKERAQAAKAAGGEYLNTQFGWLPLVGDIQNSVYAAKHAHELLDAYERNSGKVVRRRYEFPDEVTTTVTDLGAREGFVSSDINLNPDTSKPQPHLFRVDKILKRRWFSGAFTYHLPADYNSRNRLKDAAAKAGVLFGFELTPESVWNAAPWTWAIDWFSNLGDVVENISRWATDGQVLRYGYLMEHVISTSDYILDRVTRYKPYGTIYASSVTVRFESKRRIEASPFGFGLSGVDLSSRQWAIISALGMSWR